VLTSVGDLPLKTLALGCAALLSVSACSSQPRIETADGISVEQAAVVVAEFEEQVSLLNTGSLDDAFDAVHTDCEPALSREHFVTVTRRLNRFTELWYGVPLTEVELTNFRVRAIDTERVGIAALIRVVISTGRTHEEWGVEHEMISAGGDWKLDVCATALTPLPREELDSLEPLEPA
jgi:hypothetical protein